MTTYEATCGRCGRARAIDSELASAAAGELVAAIEAGAAEGARGVAGVAGVVGSGSMMEDAETTAQVHVEHATASPGVESPPRAATSPSAPAWVRRSGPPVDPRRDGRGLFEPGGGKMFGVLVAEAPDGRRVRRLAFSGIYRGAWELPGWAPPLFDAAAWYALEAIHDPEIKRIAADPADPEMHAKRAAKSAELMRRYHGLYRLPNASGVELRLADFFGEAIPSGAGDCCGPKLLAWAHRQGLRPRSLCEVFVGEARRPGTREHGACYRPCDHKCGPIMGFLLCDCADDR